MNYIVEHRIKKIGGNQHRRLLGRIPLDQSFMAQKANKIV